MNHKLTLEEIGRRAGVSRATVSRVINKPDNVTPEIRERVEKVIAETGYQPNLAARSLASRRSNILGLIIPSIAQRLFIDPYFAVLIQGITQACNQHAHTLTLFVFYSQSEQQHIYQRATQSGLVDGLIVTSDRDNDPMFDLLQERDIPFVYVGQPPRANNASFVDVDNVGGAQIATNHLIQQGCKRIAHIGGAPDTRVGRDRLEGYGIALQERARPVDERLIAYGDFTEDGGYLAMRQLLPQQPDGVFVASDMMALGALQAIKDAGLCVPDNIALVSFDDLSPAATADPPLTTVQQPVLETGRLAVETLLDILEVGSKPPRHIILPTRLLIRGSCGTINDSA